LRGMKEDPKKTAAKCLTIWPDGEDLKKKLWGTKEVFKRTAAFLAAKRLATWPDGEDLKKMAPFLIQTLLKLWLLAEIEHGRRSRMWAWYGFIATPMSGTRVDSTKHPTKKVFVILACPEDLPAIKI
jgi:hypothetical protein